MRSYTKLLLVLFVALLAVSFASASSVEITPESTSSDYVYFDEVAEYTITITNTQGIDQVFSWSVNPVEWVLESSSSVRVGPGETLSTSMKMRARPSNYKGPGFYIVPVTVQSSSESFNEQTTIYIKSVHDGGYKPSVALIATMSPELDPREPVSLQITLRNRNILNLEDLVLLIDGEEFNEEFVVELAGLEERTFEYRFDIDPLTEPGTRDLSVKLNYNEEQINEIERYYDIGAYSFIDRSSPSSSSFLFRYVKISSLENVANIEKTISLDLDIPWFERIFTNVDIEATAVEKTGPTTWDVTLIPEETGTVTVVQNYRIIPLIILLAIIAFFAYMNLRSPIVLKKQTIVTGKDEEGVSEMKVRIYIRNRTGKAFYNLRVLDRAPPIAHVKVGTGLGILEPSDIIKTNHKGTIIKWDFDTLESFEERIVTYVIKAKLKIMGPLGLPPVKAKFENSKGKNRTTSSGKAEIGGTAQ